MRRAVICSLIIVLIAAAFFAGCSGSSEQTKTNEVQIGSVILAEGEHYAIPESNITFTLIDATEVNYARYGRAVIEITINNESERQLISSETPGDCGVRSCHFGSITIDNKIRVQLDDAGDKSAIFSIYREYPG